MVYVWYDALTSYMTGIGYGEGEEGSDEFKSYWPADLHMIGKDIMRFHAVYWPAFMMAAGIAAAEHDLRPRLDLFEQDKMSKSKGNVVYPEPIVDALDLRRAGNDALRYYLLRERLRPGRQLFARGPDQRYNRDLANGLGNLASRTLTMIARYCDGNVHWRIPKPSTEDSLTGRAAGRGADASREVRCAFSFLALWRLSGQPSRPWTVI